MAGPILDAGLAEFEQLLSRLRPLLCQLLSAPKLLRLDYGRGVIPEVPGLYLFSDVDGTPR